ncbi:MAG: NADH pyrophosphatase, partial [Proteobacteria bacterium]|nr:NADH pyrophosphatase [Pseudomonadota bacterium]
MDIAFAGSHLDRADHVRSDSERLASLMDWRARVLLLDGLDPIITPENTLGWGSLADTRKDSELVFLGLADGRAHLAEVSPDLIGSVAPANPRLWAAMASLPLEELATYGAARSLVDWHARHRYCARCGNPTVL